MKGNSTVTRPKHLNLATLNDVHTLLPDGPFEMLPCKPIVAALPEILMSMELAYTFLSGEVSPAQIRVIRQSIKDSLSAAGYSFPPLPEPAKA